MNILFLSVGDSGGNCYFHSEAINCYTPYQARAIRLMQTYLSYPHDLLKPDNGTIAQLIEQANVIHIRDRINGFVIPGAKKRLITFSGMSYRRRARALIDDYANLGYKACVSTPDLIAYDKRATWIPNCREIMIPDDKHDRFTVCHAPTFRNRKGTEAIIEACRIGGIALELIEGRSYLDCLKAKSRCHVLVDQFAYGYGNNAIEAWSMRMPVISGGAEQFIKPIRRLASGDLPFVQCVEDPGKILDCIVRLKDQGEYAHWADKGHDYFLRYHHSRVVAERLVKLYEKQD